MGPRNTTSSAVGCRHSPKMLLEWEYYDYINMNIIIWLYKYEYYDYIIPESLLGTYFIMHHSGSKLCLCLSAITGTGKVGLTSVTYWICDNGE